jgi:hypothetical protein
MTWFFLHCGGGLRYNEKVIDPGAQTERRGDAGPVSNLLVGGGSPAAFLLFCSVRVSVRLEQLQTVSGS